MHEIMLRLETKHIAQVGTMSLKCRWHAQCLFVGPIIAMHPKSMLQMRWDKITAIKWELCGIVSVIFNRVLWETTIKYIVKMQLMLTREHSASRWDESRKNRRWHQESHMYFYEYVFWVTEKHQTSKIISAVVVTYRNDFIPKKRATQYLTERSFTSSAFAWFCNVHLSPHLS